jgi:hypothetical protein
MDTGSKGVLLRLEIGRRVWQRAKGGKGKICSTGQMGRWYDVVSSFKRGQTEVEDWALV